MSNNKDDDEYTTRYPPGSPLEDAKFIEDSGDSYDTGVNLGGRERVEPLWRYRLKQVLAIGAVVLYFTGLFLGLFWLFSKIVEKL